MSRDLSAGVSGWALDRLLSLPSPSRMSMMALAAW